MLQDPLEHEAMRPEGLASLFLEGTSKIFCNYYFEVLPSCHLKQKWSNKL